MRVLMVMLSLAAMPLVMSAAQSAQGQDKRRDPCTLPEGGIRRGPPDAARDRAVSRGAANKGKSDEGLNRENSVNCTPPLPPPPPPPGEDPPPAAELAEIHGTAFGDVNASLTWSAGETGLAGWTITLSGPVSASTVTGPDGSYSFIDLPPGTYLICEELQLNYWQSVPAVWTQETDCASFGTIGYLLVVSPDKPGVHFIANDFGNVPIGF